MRTVMFSVSLIGARNLSKRFGCKLLQISESYSGGKAIYFKTNSDAK